ncbi:Hsp20/alpha crystallin family protein [Paraburkholderia sp. A1RI_3L]|uniref:Hsp20/alpha crystallin family protein n=1 Tax=Paraburkholderia TaxID=1822464 RepID=UPI003B7EC905
MSTKRGGKANPGTTVEGVFSRFADLVEKLNELAQTGKELHQVKEFTSGSGVRGIYGVNVRVGLGEHANEVVVEPFGNIRRDEQSGQAVVQDVLEPVVDVFEESDHTLVVAEMPGIALADVSLDVHDDVLVIEAASNLKKYRKEVLLPRAFTREQMQLACNNGILEIRCVG